MATKTQVLDWCRSQLGYAEQSGNRTKYAAMAGHANGQPWCATFLCAGFKSKKMTLGNNSAYTPSLRASLGAKIGGPQAGAIAFLYFPDLGRVAHCGIVESVRADGRFVTIEGNTNVAGGRTGGLVMRKVRSRTNWSFYMPRYTAPTTAPAPAPAPAPTRNYGDCRLLQRAVRVTADNFWGAGTDKACDAVKQATYKKFPYGVRFVQGVVGTTQDGAWGAGSRRALGATIVNMQSALTEMSHTNVPRTGAWDTPTETAYQKVRKICRRP